MKKTYIQRRLSHLRNAAYKKATKNASLDARRVGKRYRRQDEIGTPYCITIDHDTETDNCVTIRNRDTM